jgi:SAM-dependent methyltransferase
VAFDSGSLVQLRRLLDADESPRHDQLDRLFRDEAAVPADDLEGVLGVADTRCLVDLGLLRRVDGRFEPLARIDRVGRLHVASDLRRHRRKANFVVEPGPASFLLSRHVEPPGGGRALDLGCGSGIQSLLLGAAGASVVALDINPRAVAFCRFNAALNGLRRVEPALGDFLAEPADADLDGRFDLVVSNPPFVLAPAHELTYRDRSLPGDLVSRRTVERVARALAPGGRGYVLCNWIDRGGRDWSAPVRGWLRGPAVDAVVTRTDVRSPEAYAATWTRDLPPTQREEAAAAWTRALQAEGVRRIHVGIVALRRASGPGWLQRRRITTVDRAVDRAQRPVGEAGWTGSVLRGLAARLGGHD